MPVMLEYETVSLYLDNDATGQKYIAMALTFDEHKFQDKRDLYKGFNDLNEYLVNLGLKAKAEKG